QRLALRALFPLLRFLISRSFRITPRHTEKATANIGALMADAERKLDDGRRSLLGGDAIDFVDISFASIMALWLQPASFGADTAEHVKIPPDRLPDPMRQDIENWRESFPKATAFIEQLYRERTTA
ncbi:MAG: hypothetical protein RQ826_16760, partial [Xanthomonadales bacterium]|nr:hypothetical protein [Xanthomonadales bacterium]